jgi:multiple sugar transport system permease protein
MARADIIKRHAFGYILVAPALLFMLGFFVWPVVQGFITSLTSGFGYEGDFVGLRNYGKILTDPRFWNSFRVSVIFTVVFLVISGGIGLLIATFLVKKPALYQLYASAIYIPYISTPVIGALIWQNMLSDPYGLISMLLKAIGLPTVPWLKTPTMALTSLIFIQVWYTIGYNAILFFAGLQQIPKDYYEAAEIEGCGWIRQLYFITIPLIIPTITFVVTISTLYGFVNSYVLARLITFGGPFEATFVMMMYIFEYAFKRFDFGMANAATVITFIFLSGVAVAQFRFQRKRFVGLH